MAVSDWNPVHRQRSQREIAADDLVPSDAFCDVIQEWRLLDQQDAIDQISRYVHRVERGDGLDFGFSVSERALPDYE